MTDLNRATGRAAAVIGLLLVSGAALRGYLPPAGPVQRHPEAVSPVWPAVILVLLALSLGITAAAVLDRLRHRRGTGGGPGTLPDTPAGEPHRPAWRVLLIGLAAAAGLAALWSATRLLGRPRLAGLPHPPHGSTGAPGAPGGTAPAGPPPADTLPAQQGGQLLDYLAWGAAAVLALTVLGVVAAARRAPPPPADADVAGGAAEPQPPARTARLGPAAIADPARDPRAAILACWVTLEDRLGRLPQAVPQRFDTPTEVAERAIRHRVLTADSATGLTELFTEARFSTHPLTEAHRAAAIGLLARVLAELGEPR